MRALWSYGVVLVMALGCAGAGEDGAASDRWRAQGLEDTGETAVTSEVVSSADTSRTPDTQALMDTRAHLDAETSGSPVDAGDIGARTDTLQTADGAAETDAGATGDTNRSCPEHFTGTDCDVCEHGWEGPDCMLCPPNFAGDDCDICAGAWQGQSCDVCPPQYTGAACDVCANGWVGDGCDVCPINFSGDDCDTCAGFFTGDACDVCPSSYSGPACDSCAPSFMGDACEVPVDYEGFIGIPAGTFTMGCTDGQQQQCEPNESPDHEVTLTHAFWISETEVTQAQYAAVMGENPSVLGGCQDCPVESVSFFDALLYANTRSVADGLAPCYDLDGTVATVLSPSGSPYECAGYRLPTEAEWEYAARAGEDWLYAGGDEVALVSWYAGNSNGQTHPVAQKAPNAFGLFDMSGNVYEWCWDLYKSTYYLQSPSIDPTGALESTKRSVRGGSYDFIASGSRTTRRYSYTPANGITFIGIRLVRTAL